MAFTITADSEPILDGLNLNPYWGKQEWMDWHKLNVKKYDESVANAKFKDWWFNKQSFWAAPYSWAKYNTEFANYFKKYGIDVSSIVSAPIIATQNVVTDVSSAATSTGKVLKYGVPVLIAVGLGLILYYGAKKINN